MGNFYMESTQINYRRDEKLKTVDQKLQELSETSAIDTDIAPVFKSTNTYQPGDMVYYRNKLYVFNVEHTGAWASADVTATDVTSAMNAALAGKADYADLAGAFNSETAYTAGDLVIYNGIVYRCTNDHTGAWDADDFSATTIAAELNSINSNLTSNIVEYKTDVEAPVRVNLFNKDSLDKANKYYDGTEWHNVSSGGWITVFIPVIGGVTYTASGFPAQGGVKTVFTTGDKTTVLSDFSASENNSTRTAPNNAKYIGFGIYSPNADYTSAQFEIGSTSTTYTPYIPSVESRLEAVEQSELTLSLFDDQNTLLDSCIVKAGKIVTFTAKVTMGTDVSRGVYLLVNMPKAITTLANNTGIVSVSCSRNVHLCVGNNSNNSAGVFTLDTLTEGETYIISGTYISA